MVKNPPDKAGDAGDRDSIPGSGRFSGLENGNPVQYSYLRNPMEGVVWQATAMKSLRNRT